MSGSPTTTVQESDDESDWRQRTLASCPAELLELSHRLQGTFTLHDGRWGIRGNTERAAHPVGQRVDIGDRSFQLLSEFTAFADLSDGRRACCVSVHPKRGADPDWWVVILRDDEAAARTTPVVAKGIRQFFERILDEDDQPFFDVPGFVPESTLAETGRW